MKNNEKVLLMLAVGLATGALMGILLAPHKGSKTRRMIKGQGKKVVDDLYEKVEVGKEGFNALKKDITQAVSETFFK